MKILVFLVDFFFFQYDIYHSFILLKGELSIIALHRNIVKPEVHSLSN